MFIDEFVTWLINNTLESTARAHLVLFGILLVLSKLWKIKPDLLVNYKPIENSQHWKKTLLTTISVTIV